VLNAPRLIQREQSVCCVAAGKRYSVCPAKSPSLKASTEIINAIAMFAYTGFNFVNMAHPLSIKSIKIICCLRIQLLSSAPDMQQPLCQRVPPLVI
jgi:hypothetical protein